MIGLEHGLIFLPVLLSLVGPLDQAAIDVDGCTGNDDKVYLASQIAQDTNEENIGLQN